MNADDVRALPSSPLVVAEGSTLGAGLVDPARALWLLPPAESLLAETIEREAREHDVPILVVDGTRGIDETVAYAEERFAAALAEGPCARTRAERQPLLREANEAVVAQVRAYYARPWAVGNAEQVVRSFVCECGATDCIGSLERPVGRAALGPVLTAGHVVPGP
jgi:hypothetical protein